ncbi:MAG: hypothetical protein QXP01_01285 [Candidatus Hadarchaeum sp.]
MRSIVFAAVCAVAIYAQMMTIDGVQRETAAYHYDDIYAGDPYEAMESSLIVQREMDELYHPGETSDYRKAIIGAVQRRIDAHGGSLTASELRLVLEVAGWPPELIDDAMEVAWCESRWSPYAVGDSGRSLGMFQLWNGWYEWAGYSAEQYGDVVVSAATAAKVAERDMALGRGPWHQWSCKPLN